VSLELLNTLATLATTLIIAATAIAAMVQLRHLRASNQIAGQLALRQVLLGDEFMTALGRMRDEIPPLLSDPGFRAYVHDFHVHSIPDANERYESAYACVLTVGRNLENVGNMIRNGLTDRRIFLEQYVNLVTLAWDVAEPLIKIRREATHSDADFEDFEYLTVLARRWATGVRSVYPKDLPRILPSGKAPSR